MERTQTDRTKDDGSITLSREAEEHLREAVTRMDLLLKAEQVANCLDHLVAMLQHLRALGRAIF